MTVRLIHELRGPDSLALTQGLVKAFAEFAQPEKPVELSEAQLNVLDKSLREISVEGADFVPALIVPPRSGLVGTGTANVLTGRDSLPLTEKIADTIAAVVSPGHRAEFNTGSLWALDRAFSSVKVQKHDGKSFDFAPAVKIKFSV